MAVIDGAGAALLWERIGTQLLNGAVGINVKRAIGVTARE